MPHGELTENGLQECLYTVIKDWYENIKEGVEIWKIVRSEKGDFDIRIESYEKKQCIIRVRLFENYERVYQLNMTLYAGTFDKYSGKPEDLIKVIATDISKNVERRESID